MIRVFLPVLLLTGILSGAVALAGIGEYEVRYSMAYEGPDVVSLMVMPDGSGPDFTEARIAFGNPVDATINVEFLDAVLDLVVGFPSEDMWLESRDSGMVMCAGGTVADGPTDAAGRTTFSLPPRAGGWSADVTQVVISGSPVYTQAGLDLHINSPDINGDLQVNLSDVQLFAEDFYGSYHFRSDLSYDLQVNLSDLLPMAEAMGAACP